MNIVFIHLKNRNHLLSGRMDMSRIIKINFAAFPLVLASLVAIYPNSVKAADDLKPFPEAEVGYRRFVMHLPPVDVPEDRKVEMIFGKMMEVDCNRHMFSGRLESRVVQGWGYQYYVLADIKGPASTMMACPADEQKRNDFVRVRLDFQDAQFEWQRYNSKLPIVVYVPDGIEVRYRIWLANQQTATALQE